MKDHRSIMLGSDIKNIDNIPEGADLDFCYTMPDGFYYVAMKPIGRTRAGNSRRERPQYIPGKHPRWPVENPAAKDWEQVENHIGEDGYLEGEPTTIKAFGPYPEGWNSEPPKPALEQIKKEAIALVKSKRQQVEYSGFIFNGQRWDSEEKDEMRLNSAMNLFSVTGATEIPGWKISENTYIVLTPEVAAGAAVAFMEHTAAAFQIEVVKQQEIAALTSADAVQEWLDSELDKGWNTIPNVTSDED